MSKSLKPTEEGPKEKLRPWKSQYIPSKTVDKSYRPKNYLMSPGLQRARRPFRTKNAITGLILGAFGVGVWAYSISAVKQDNFDDVDEEARAIAAASPVRPPRADVIPSSTTSTSPAVTLGEAAAIGAGITPLIPSPPALPVRGILAKYINSRYPEWLDPTRKTLIWGAPPVDKIGSIRESNAVKKMVKKRKVMDAKP